VEVVAGAVREGADPAEGAIIIGHVFLQRGLYGEALERFDEALERRPGDGEAQLGRTRCLLELDRVEEAVAAAEALEPLTNGRIDRLLTVGEAFVKAGEGKRALEALEEAVKVAPRDPVVQRQMARAALALGNRRKAREAYRLAIAEDPDFTAARVELARILMDEGAYAEAEGEIRDALELMPAYAEGNLVLAELLRRQGRTRETINLLATLLEVEPYNLDALVILGEALGKEDRRKDAQQALQRVLRFDAERPVALFRMGELCAEAGRYREALDYWRQLMEVAPDSDYADRARVQARVAMGRGAAPIAAGGGG
jgi:tetratricopeptide (TPR) repeat protein